MLQSADKVHQYAFFAWCKDFLIMTQWKTLKDVKCDMN